MLVEGGEVEILVVVGICALKVELRCRTRRRRGSRLRMARRGCEGIV